MKLLFDMHTLGIISGEAISLSKSINPPLISCIKSSPPTISAPAFFASSIFSPEKFKHGDHQVSDIYWRIFPVIIIKTYKSVMPYTKKGLNIFLQIYMELWIILSEVIAQDLLFRLGKFRSDCGCTSLKLHNQ